MSGTLSLTFDNTPGAVTLPISGTGVAVSIDWGDSEPVDTSLSHTYTGTGPFTAVVTITSSATSVEAFGADGWAGVANLTAVATSNTATWGLGTAVTSFSNLFRGASSLISVPTGIPPSVTNMNNMFFGASAFNQNIGAWVVGNVTTMSGIFVNASIFNQNIGGWDVGKVTNMSYMFQGASQFNQNIGDWNVSKVTNMNYMFNNAFAFDQNIGAWDVGKVTSMSNMFRNASTFNRNIGAWDVSIVTNMTSMFDGASAFDQNIRYWSVQFDDTLDNMFAGATAMNGTYAGTIGYADTPQFIFFNVPDTLSLTFDNSAGNLQVRLPIIGTDVRATIDWGDGVTDTDVDPNVTTHTYPASGFPSPTAIVTITSSATSVTRFGSDGWPGVAKLTAVATSEPLTWSLGTNVSSFANLFRGAGLLTSVPTRSPESVINMHAMFFGASIFNQNINAWNVSNVTDMSYMFYTTTAFNNGESALSWLINGTGTANVIIMNDMFFGALAFNQDISEWVVSNVADMSSMFRFASAFNQNIGDWNVRSVTTMGYMFYGASAFNQNIRSWSVQSNTNLDSMFLDATEMIDAYSGTTGFGITPTDQFFNQTLSLTFDNSLGSLQVRLPIIGTGVLATIDWGDGVTDTGVDPNVTTHTYPASGLPSPTAVVAITSSETSVTTFGADDWIGVGNLTAVATGSTATWGLGTAVTSFANLFKSAVLLTSVPTGIPPSVTNMTYMFYNARLFNQDISLWNVSNVTIMYSMFGEAVAFNNGGSALSWSDGTGTSNVTTMNRMFTNATAFNQNIGTWNVSSVTDMSYMFQSASQFNNAGSALSWSAGTGTSNVLTMDAMFTGASVFNQDIGGWNVSSVTDMYGMFGNASAFNNGGSALSWSTGTGTSNVTRMSEMFNSASAFNQNISTWDVSKVTNMGQMFFNAGAFNQNIGGWNVSDVTNMSYMFYNAAAFNNGGSALSWSAGTGTSKVVDMNRMFSGATTFNQNIGTWNVSSVLNMSYMFQSASAFDNAGSALSWSTGTGTSLVTNMESMFTGATTFNQNIGAWNVSSVTNMFAMFDGASAFNNGGSALSWSAGTGTSNVTSMGSMFRQASAFNQNIGTWNVGSVTNMGNMFRQASAFNQNIRYWSVQDGDLLDDMFLNATAFHTAFYPTTPGYNTDNATPLFTFFNVVPSTLSLTFANTAGLAVTLPISGTGVAVSINWGDGDTDTSPSHTYAGTGPFTAVVIITSSATSVTSFGSDGWAGVANLTAVATSDPATWGLGTAVTSFANLFKGASSLTSVPVGIPPSVTNMTSMFNGASIFNQNIGGWNVGSVTNMSGMFQSASAFNQTIGGWNVSSVTNMTSMFQSAIAFNQSIEDWNVGSVTNMTSMFNGASIFNQNIRYWSVQSTDDLDDMFTSATAMITTYTGTTGFGTTPLFTFFNVINPLTIPCFLEGTQILCLQKNVEVYCNIEDLRKGDLVKTIYNEYVPIRMIGTTKLYNPGNNERSVNRLYKCSRENYPSLFEDLYITGCHSILVPFITYKQADDTKAILGELFVTDNHCRLMACVDEKAEPYNHAGCMNIYHIALEHYDECMNYGIYANGLLVESCSIDGLKYSTMRILGEEEVVVCDGIDKHIFNQSNNMVETC